MIIASNDSNSLQQFNEHPCQLSRNIIVCANFSSLVEALSPQKMYFPGVEDNFRDL